MKFNIVFRILLGVSSLLVALTFFLPLWNISLWAPQYPEGLNIEIWYNDVKGDVDIINGLNHYIGMKHIKPEMFPEFTFLKYIIVAFILYGLSVAIIGTFKSLKIFCTVCVLGGITALADFYRWGYDYGHNLDPTAPINVPGMSYQPPVLGYKDLLNFRALSIPAIGGWIIVGVGVIAFMALAFHWFSQRKLKTSNATLLAIPLLLGLFSACNEAKPELIFGKDDCHFCKMKLMDSKFGLAFITPKGKTYKFDDYHCYQTFLKETPTEISKTYVVVFDQPGTLIESSLAVFVRGANIKSPMGSGVAFFTNEKNALSAFPENEGNGVFADLSHE
ncbi:MAG: nitrous oxide reductase accessory protein NosL [bacterium]|nr:nitrous oxide reductase accessory protein NosL [bacterium]